MFFDTHTHLHDPVFDPDRPEVLGRARAAGVTRMLTIGTDLDSSRAAVELAHRLEGVYATVGVHPHDAAKVGAADLEELARLAEDPENRVVAWGETGLDYHHLHSPAEVQKRRFHEQIRLARRIGLPLVIHSRNAPDDTLGILREEGAAEIGGVLHCFTGASEMATRAIELGFYISFSGILTFGNAQGLRETAAKLPANRVLIETDSPYLAPVPHRGKRNEPAHVQEVARCLAEVWGRTEAEVARITSENTTRLFGLNG